MGGQIQPWIETHSGKQFWYTTEDLEGICIEDIAHALAHNCRYTGQCEYFYSVGEHSLNVAELLPGNLKLWGLLHDASEAYLSDIASPAKQLLPDYKRLEHGIMCRIALKFGLPEGFWDSPEVKAADWAQLKTESRALLPSQGKDWYFPPVVGEGLYPSGLKPDTVRELFLAKFREYEADQNTKAA